MSFEDLPGEADAMHLRPHEAKPCSCDQHRFCNHNYERKMNAGWIYFKLKHTQLCLGQCNRKNKSYFSSHCCIPSICGGGKLGMKLTCILLCGHSYKVYSYNDSKQLIKGANTFRNDWWNLVDCPTMWFPKK